MRGVLDSWALCSVGGKEICGKWNMKKMKKMLACLWGWQLTGLQKKTGTNTECKLLSYLLILFYKWQIMIDGLLLSYSYFFLYHSVT